MTGPCHDPQRLDDACDAVVQIVEQADFVNFFESLARLCRSKIPLHPDISSQSVEPS
jgi:hypothetical protein